MEKSLSIGITNATSSHRYTPNLKLFDAYPGKGIDPNGKVLRFGLDLMAAFPHSYVYKINDSIDERYRCPGEEITAVLRNGYERIDQGRNGRKAV
ncbi:MAG: hypothetical protein WD356_09445 [Pseudomonadales bacterium]